MAIPLRMPRCRLATLLISAFALLGGISYVLLSLSPCRNGALNCYRGYSSAFSFDANRAHHADWMRGLPDDARLESLSLPGTHDTMTYGIAKDTLRCQIWSLATQLRAGVRYVDIRARLFNDDLYIYHADGYTGFSYADVLLDLFDFLDEHPSETVVMRLKDEGPPLGDSTTASFEDVFNFYRSTSPVTADGASKHMYLHDPTQPIPSLGALRSKVFVLQNFRSAGAATYGLAWDGPQMALEDYWIVPDVAHLADKWEAIRGALERVSAAAPDDGLLYLAHISAAVGVLPVEAAAGPKNGSLVGMNDMTGQWLNDFDIGEAAARAGVVIFDFPGQRAIDAVLRWNRLPGET